MIVKYVLQLLFYNIWLTCLGPLEVDLNLWRIHFYMKDHNVPRYNPGPHCKQGQKVTTI